jgi:hypothetical protein
MTISEKRRPSPPQGPSWLRPGSTLPTILVLPWALSVCHAAPASAPGTYMNAADKSVIASQKTRSKNMHMTIGTRRFVITLADSNAARAFSAQLPLSLRMADLNGNEKHAQLGTALPANATPPGTIRNGDLMLYGSATLVLFYLTFDSAYPYTRLGRVNDPDGMKEALGAHDVRVTFTMEEK